MSALWVCGIIFTVLKLSGTVDWSWWIVTLPFWAELALVLGILFAAFILGAINLVLCEVGDMLRKK